MYSRKIGTSFRIITEAIQWLILCTLPTLGPDPLNSSGRSLFLCILWTCVGILLSLNFTRGIYHSPCHPFPSTTVLFEAIFCKFFKKWLV